MTMVRSRQKKRAGRLATVGFGGRKDDAPGQPVPHTQLHPQAHPQEAAQPVRPVEPPPRAPVSSVHAEYAKRPPVPQGYRPAQGALDPQGRIASPVRAAEDDQLEIPAFLRRQAN